MSKEHYRGADNTNNTKSFEDITVEASSETLSLLRKYAGNEVIHFLQSTGHTIYHPMDPEGGLIQSSFYVRESGRVLSLDLQDSENTDQEFAIIPSFAYERDFIRNNHLMYTRVNPDLGNNTLGFLRFVFETFRRIKEECPVIIEAYDDRRLNVYRKLLGTIGSPENIILQNSQSDYF